MWSIYGNGCDGKYVMVEKDPDDELGRLKRPVFGAI
jgi:hypothetical protein